MDSEDEQTTGRTTASVKYRLAATAAAMLAVFAIVIAVMREQTTWTRTILINGQSAEATITESHDFGLMFGHGYLFGGGNLEHRSILRFRDGSAVQFRTQREPMAIWEANGALHVASYYPGFDWAVDILGKDGHVTSVPREKWPRAIERWNLRPPSEDDFWNKLYHDWGPPHDQGSSGEGGQLNGTGLNN